MPTTSGHVRETVRRILANKVGLNTGTGDGSVDKIAGDPVCEHLDSLGLIEFGSQVEEQCSLRLSDDDLVELAEMNLDQIVALVENRRR